jgi:hypothetical protein
MKNIKLFINEYKTKYDNKTLSYYAGEICQDGDITNQQRGAEETFCIGMPIFDEEGNELGKLSIGLFEDLNYSVLDMEIKIPVETWRVDGYKSDVRKRIKTYYQVIKS